MNSSIAKNNVRRGRHLFGWLLKDWVWELFLIVLVAPVVVDSFLSIGTNVTV